MAATTVAVQCWERLGHWFVPQPGEAPWCQSHASTPVVQHLHDDHFRLFFTCRDAQKRSHIASVDLDLFRPQESAQPTLLLEPGEVGTFDDSGVSLGCVLGDKLYYVGWNLGVTVPFRNSIGLAVREEERYRRVSMAPIMDRSAVDPFHLSYPWVEQEGDHYRMWYGSNLCWGEQTDTMRHVIKEAESTDGVHWQRSGRVAVPLTDSQEIAVARPCVTRDVDGYHMWYSFKSKLQPYAIGYARSEDGVAWTRHDEAVTFIGPCGDWESEMQCYPFCFNHKGERYLLYCGNYFGRTGCGLARMA